MRKTGFVSGKSESSYRKKEHHPQARFIISATENLQGSPTLAPRKRNRSKARRRTDRLPASSAAATRRRRSSPGWSRCTTAVTPTTSARPTAPPTPRPVAFDSAPQPTTRPPTQESSPTPRPVALDSALTQESSPTSRPTEPSATPDDPLGLPEEESATAAPTTESDAALERRLAWAAAACALAALLL